MTPDIADIIAGELKVSRGTAYDMMREALKQTEQPAAWVGLTDDEFNELYDAYKNSKGIGALMQRVEAKLREKNGGAAQPADHTEQHLDMVRALDALLVVQDELCSVDHHGYCQSHYLDNVNSYGGCRVANARALVAKVKGGA